jgi:hypothetical protein
MSGVSPACRSLTVDALSVHLDVVGASLDCPERAGRCRLPRLSPIRGQRAPWACVRAPGDAKSVLPEDAELLGHSSGPFDAHVPGGVFGSPGVEIEVRLRRLDHPELVSHV